MFTVLLRTCSISVAFVLVLTALLHLAIYIPGFNDRVLYQAPIDWEWGLVFGMTFVFVAFCEVWKLVRKPIYKRAGWWKEMSDKTGKDNVANLG